MQGNLRRSAASLRLLLPRWSREKKINLAGLALSCLSHVILSKVLGSKGVSLTLGNQGSEADWPYQGSIEAAKVTLVPWSHQYLFFFRALAQTWS